MAQVDSTHAHATTAGRIHPAVPVVLFVGLVGLVNVALNRLLTLYRSLLPPSLQFEYVVTAPFTPVAAVVLLVGGGIASICALALFVDSVGATASGSSAGSGERRLDRVGRATVVGVGGTLVVAVGLALFVVPGLVALVYLPVVFVGVVLDGRTVAGAIEASHDRIRTQTVPIVSTVLVGVACLLAIGFGGMFSSVLTPTVEFAVGGASSALVILLVVRRLTSLYRRRSSRTVTAESGQL